MSKRIKNTRIPKDHVHVLIAADALRTALGGWPRPRRDALALAREHVAEELLEDAWLLAPFRLGVRMELIGGEWWWRLPGDSILSELDEWLQTPAGRFASYAAERDRLRALIPPGAQLELE